MAHRDRPLTPEGGKRLVERCRTRPIAHVAAEMGISRATASKWVGRYRRYGALGRARAWNSEQERADALTIWNRHYNYHGPQGAHDSQPPASQARARVNNVLASYTQAYLPPEPTSLPISASPRSAASSPCSFARAPAAAIARA